MSKLSGRQAKTIIYKLGDVEINLKPIPFGKIMEIQKAYKDIQNDSEDVQIEYIKSILLDHTDLEEGDFSTADYALTVEEATEIFSQLLKSNQDPKVLGQSQR
jgi:hypothetical protein